jgi:hypothetical protein
VEIRTRKLFKELISKLTHEVLDEITATGNVDGFGTPNAFKKSNGKKKKKAGFAKGHKKPGVFGYNVVSETIDEKDLKQITKLIKDVVGDILRDIWLKRTAWK